MFSKNFGTELAAKTGNFNYGFHVVNNSTKPLILVNIRLKATNKVFKMVNR
jgi:hypothetical protein